MAQIRALLDQADGDLITALDARARAVREFIALRERDPQGYHSLPSAAEVLTRLRDLRKDFPEKRARAGDREILGACAEMIAPGRGRSARSRGGPRAPRRRRWFGSRSVFRALATVPEVFTDLDRGRAIHAVVPFETSSDGALAATLQSLGDTQAEGDRRDHAHNSWHLYSRTGNAGDIEKVYGAASAIAACERTCGPSSRAPRCSTCARDRRGQLALEDHGAAALGTGRHRRARERCSCGRSERSGSAARRPRRTSRTRRACRRRFSCSATSSRDATGTDRTIIVLALGGEPGSLYAALQPFAERGINLTRLRVAPGARERLARRVLRGARWPRQRSSGAHRGR